jgi:hypothetical protein
MKIKLSILLLFVSAIIFSSCSKSSTATPLTNTQLLTQHTWEFEQTIVQEGNNQTMYIRDSTNTTGYDYDVDTYEFNTNGTGVLNDGSNNIYTFTWAFNSDETAMTLIIDYSGTYMTFTDSFIQLSQNSFYFTQSNVTGGVEGLAENELIPVP